MNTSNAEVYGTIVSHDVHERQRDAKLNSDKLAIEHALAKRSDVQAASLQDNHASGPAVCAPFVGTTVADSARIGAQTRDVVCAHKFRGVRHLRSSAWGCFWR